jgi:hypothetical protein
MGGRDPANPICAVGGEENDVISTGDKVTLNFEDTAFAALAPTRLCPNAPPPHVDRYALYFCEGFV